MAYVIERTFVRSNTETQWPSETFPVDKQTELLALRETHGVTHTASFSADGLSAVYTESCSSEQAYANYFSQAKAVWAAGNIISEENATGVSGTTTANNGITINVSVLENT
jgi:hypothetical protein